MQNAHDDLDESGDDHDAPPESAASLLARVKPFSEWLSESWRTSADIAMYRFIVAALEANIRPSTWH